VLIRNTRRLLQPLKKLLRRRQAVVAMLASLLWNLLTPSLPLGICAGRQITPARG